MDFSSWFDVAKSIAYVLATALRKISAHLKYDTALV